ncbi:MAG: LysR family nitrogen assimilation transcriptional regulator [Halieaceae bacterium]|jgi:LysR family nitrogen assimilation transcriptional regulator
MQSLRIFVAAYEEGSFTLAANRENATQSGVSQHIRNLEDRYGVPLFRREKGRVFPTPAADRFYKLCLEALRSTDAALGVLGQFSEGLSGETAVGIMPTLSAGALAPTLLKLRRLHPNIHVHVHEAFSSVLVERVLKGEVECAIVPAMPAKPGLRVTPFFRCDEVFVQQRGTGNKKASAAQMDGNQTLKIVLPENANVRANQIRSYLAENNVVIEQSMEMNSMMATLDLIAQSDWCAILPALMMATRSYQSTFSVRPMKPALSLKLVVIEPARRNLTPVTEAFLQELRTSCEALVTS